MGTNFLESFPDPGSLTGSDNGKKHFTAFNANSHIHTPFSFSAFANMDEIFRIAADENIDLLGINDFFVTDGYDVFHDRCAANHIFPLFNIEFIGLIREKQKAGIRINDPNNPGRIYFTGKGLDYPFHLSPVNMEILERVREETQNQLKEMVEKLNLIIEKTGSGLRLDFGTIRKRFAERLVRERHLAKAIRTMANENFSSPGERIGFIESLYGGKKSKTGIENPSALENEIRSNLLKAGGPAFVEEEESSFLDVRTIIGIIRDAGGIPCYPVLLDDQSGKFTEYEGNPGLLHRELSELGVCAIEFIPGRNDHVILERYAGYFDDHGYIITFGTEHNTPEMIPLTIKARGGIRLNEKLTRINSEGASVIAAHQYLRARKMEGFNPRSIGSAKRDKERFIEIGQTIIRRFLNAT